MIVFVPNPNKHLSMHILWSTTFWSIKILGIMNTSMIELLIVASQSTSMIGDIYIYI